MKICHNVDVGLMGYAEAWELQKRLVAARKIDAIEDVLLLCEHPHVITLGRNGKRENLLASEQVLRQKGVEFHASNRGGDITYHGPGQMVGYPILNLGAIRKDVVWYVRMLEEAMIRATAEFRRGGGAGGRKNWHLGVRVRRTRRRVTEEKLGAIGVHISRWVTSHGFAYNVSTDLRYFDLIVPCGIAGRKATSLEKILGRAVSRKEVMQALVRNFGEVFGLEMRETSLAEFRSRLTEQPSVGEANLEHAHAVAALS